MTKRNTIQKETVAMIVKDACNHPTAEMVLEQAKRVIPGISLGTVYRILKEMARDGEIREVVCKDAPSRFDKTVVNHGHFICDRCGCVEDVFIKLDKIDDEIVDFEGKIVLESQIFFRGICLSCQNKANIAG